MISRKDAGLSLHATYLFPLVIFLLFSKICFLKSALLSIALGAVATIPSAWARRSGHLPSPGLAAAAGAISAHHTSKGPNLSPLLPQNPRDDGLLGDGGCFCHPSCCRKIASQSSNEV